MNKRTRLCGLLLLGLVCRTAAVGLYEVLELEFTGGVYNNPYTEVELAVTFFGPEGSSFTLRGFWDGGAQWKIRVAPTIPGDWTWTTTSNDPLLNGLSGGFSATASGGRGFVKPAGHGFRWSDGTPFFRMGDTCYRLFRDRNAAYDSLFIPYINARASQGFNCIYAALHTSGLASRNEGGALWYNDTDFDRLQPGYFAWVDRRIDYMLDRGIMPGLILAWSTVMDDFSREQYERYVRYVVARYAAFNVTWLVAAAYNTTLSPAEYAWHGQLIASEDPYDHPLSLVPSAGHSSAEDLALFSPWMSFISHHDDGTPAALNARVVADRQHGYPVCNDEFGYEGPQDPDDPWYYDNNRSAEQVRAAAWAISMGGGFFTWGSIYTYTGQELVIRLDQLESPGAQNMRHLAAFFSGIDAAAMQPDNRLVNAGNYCLVRADSELVIYAPQGGGIDVDLENFEHGYTLTWIDPADGRTVDGGAVAGGTLRHLVSPLAADAVLHLEITAVPVADFRADPLSGWAPLTVSFTDQSSGLVDFRTWDFGDGTPVSHERHPVHIYSTPGIYTPALIVAGVGGGDSESKAGYITVRQRPPAPIADFTADTTSGAWPLAVHFRSLAQGEVDSLIWDFGDGLGLVNSVSPWHRYESPGVYSVSLRCVGPGGEDRMSRAGWITVLAEPAPAEIPVYEAMDLLFPGGVHGDPYWDVDLTARFTGPGGESLQLPGFWIGDNGWKLRFAPTAAGLWHFTTRSNDPLLDGRSGTLNALPATSHGFFTTAGRHFFYTDGTPVLRLGDTNWRMFRSKNVPFDSLFKPYVDARAAQGFNMIQGVIHTVGDPSINEGGSLWRDDVDLAQLQPGYFDYVDKRIDYLQQRGICTGMLFTWSQNFAAFSQGQFERFVRYLVARYCARHVIWNISGEYTEEGPAEEYGYFGSLVKSLDPYHHPITIHPGGNQSNSRDFALFSPWLSYILQQIYGTPAVIHTALMADREYGRPVCNDEFGFEGPTDPGDPDYSETNRTGVEIRQIIWSILTAGGYFTYGHINTCTAKERTLRLNQLASPGAACITRMRRFLSDFSIPYWQMEPDGRVPQSARIFCLRQDTSRYLFYLLDGDTLRADLSAVSGRLDGLWFDPETGATWHDRTVAGGDTLLFLPPLERDMILYLSPSRWPLLEAGLSLQGSSDPVAPVMRTTLADSGLIPLTSPYVEDPVTVRSIPRDVVDWLLVQLEAEDGGVVHSASCFLRRDGRIVPCYGGEDFIALPGVADGQYRLTLRHRHHLAARSAGPLPFNAGAMLTYDFRTGQDRYADPLAAREVKPGHWGVRGGDANRDGRITTRDYLPWYQGNEQEAEGYLEADFDLDGKITPADYLLWLDNARAGAAVE